MILEFEQSESRHQAVGGVHIRNPASYGEVVQFPVRQLNNYALNFKNKDQRGKGYILGGI